ncbi:type 2 lanthipeptide synthetase LanM family protein [Bacillus cereus]|uniref:type 2 lanthipeptide synthetase LanM family protein n=1 Tax=Bacillus cereus TaxID=1396 RepID=UPI001643D826|nr:type 2 lanthipeptide synthetase LanM family protein [Bacillus cereus]MCU4733610.1 type 2 lanthipeptide synthetase LanM family protein [Bacillus cereus]MCU5149228.1 type 2 lanthipeptide synthetase LanM family protein [Bacillus cereus]MCU5496174.1 type 2 lanthipeptide synthetase LanM family protein [Bacillus cereus]MCU5639337.1 type 2 lanthipeptide synthetase LanM family protein [Bacillus cereus]
MIKDYNKSFLMSLSLTTTIRQRSEILHKFKDSNNNIENQLANLKQWRSRKTLVEEDTFNLKLDFEKLSPKDFDLGIKQLTEEEKVELSQFVRNEEWFLYFDEIVKHFDKKDFEFPILDFSYGLRLFIFWTKEKVTELMKFHSDIKFNDESFIMLMESYCQDLLQISEKTLVYDLHEFKKKHTISGKDSQERFKQYLKTRFENTEKILEFFSEYPTLLKLMTYRTKFFLANIADFMNHLSQKKLEINDVFNFNGQWIITNFKMGAGDSHQQGKTVILFKVDEQLSLVYKPKELKVAERYNEFLKWIGSKDPRFEFYTPKRVYATNFSFEEFITYEDCQNEKEIEQFYQSFGHLISIVYMIRGNDLHLENLIAHGKYPVLIDVETLFQHITPIVFANDATTKASILNLDSVLTSGLIPFTIASDRDDDGKGVEMSALSGDRQKVPFQVLRASNINSDEMRYEPKEIYFEGSNNIPKLNNKKVNFSTYNVDIIKGFKDMCSFFYENKTEILDLMHKLFDGVLVRNVIKSTQRYSDTLAFSNHPSCTKDFIEREKLLENLWAYPYLKKEAVLYEIEDLSLGDIPVFFSKVNSNNLISSNGGIIEGFYDKPAMEKVVDRISNLDQYTILKQSSYLEVALGIYKGNIQTNRGSITKKDLLTFNENVILDEVENISEQLIRKMIISKDKISTGTWNDIILDNNGKWGVSPLNINLYDGLCGLLLYFSSVHHVTKNKKYKDILEMIENQIYSTITLDSKISAFSGKGSYLYPMSVIYLQTGNEKYENLLQKVTEELMGYFEKSENKDKPDWISGYSGVIKNFVNIYKLTQKDIYKKSAEELAKFINLEHISLGGFAHGYSGVAYALACLGDITDNPTEYYSRSIEALNADRNLFSKEHQGWIDKRFKNEIKVSHKWCNGTTGIGLSRLNMEKYLEDKKFKDEIDICYRQIIQENKMDDCLCHGNFGDIEFLLQYYLATKDKNVYKLIINKISNIHYRKEQEGKYLLRGLDGFENVGLLTGLSGIGYEYLRVLNPNDVHNVLGLDLKIK